VIVSKKTATSGKKNRLVFHTPDTKDRIFAVFICHPSTNQDKKGSQMLGRGVVGSGSEERGLFFLGLGVGLALAVGV
jgi:hypothetical protein